MIMNADESWMPLIEQESGKEYFRSLTSFVDDERRKHQVYPPDELAFNAFRLTPYHAVKAVIVGQDPYHGEHQAHGLCFSVSAGVAKPPSLVNIFKELSSDIGCAVPETGDLSPWARQGVFLLNAVMSVRAGEAGSHRDKGWETFTDTVIRNLSENSGFLVFILWGAFAQKKASLIDSRHCILSSVHPSPLSVYRGFFGSRPFSKTNEALKEHGIDPVDWILP